MVRFIVPFACFLSVLFSPTLEAQITRCSSNEQMEAQLQSDTAFARSFFALEQALEQMSSTGYRTTTDYNLPVVVHIMHDGDAVGDGANLSNSQIQSAMDALNADFAGDFGGADIDIQFSLAVRDPEGNPTSGINRINVADFIPEFTEHGLVTNDSQHPSSEGQVKSLSQWPNDDYVNIWVLSKLNGGTSPIGFAYLPPAPSALDGIVVHHRVFGVGEEYDLINNYDLNRTLTHEAGHYLGLYHTFHLTSACGNESNCASQGDRVCDTPQTTGSLNCSALECEDTMVENFMDYSHDPCMSSFTEGQRTRMRNALTQSRTALLESAGNIPVVALDAGVASVQGLIPVGCNSTQEAMAVLQNFGTDAITAVTVHFQLDGGQEHMVNWTGELAPSATELVALPSVSAPIGQHEMTVWTTTPNDEYALNDSLTTAFEVVPGNMLTMDIQFDFLPYGITWTVENEQDMSILSGGNYVNAEFASEFISVEGCATPGCYALTIEDLFGNGMHYSPPGWYELSDSDGNVLGSGSGDFGSEQTHEFCVEPTDVAACPDQNGNGICDADEGMLVTDIPGCMDVQSCTYSELATVDDGSCEFLDALSDRGGDCPADVDDDGVCDNAEVYGCEDPSACNYEPEATEENGSCTYPEVNFDCFGNVVNVVLGCTDPTSCTFDAQANTDDGSCDYLDALGECGGDCPADVDEDGVCDNAEILGCTDSAACNFEASATEEDSSCEYAEEGYDCAGNPLINSVEAWNASNVSLTAFPNPIDGSQLSISGLPGPGFYHIHLLDLAGKQLSAERIQAQGVQNMWTVRTELDVKSGLYLIQVATGNAKKVGNSLRILVK